MLQGMETSLEEVHGHQITFQNQYDQKFSFHFMSPLGVMVCKKTSEALCKATIGINIFSLKCQMFSFKLHLPDPLQLHFIFLRANSSSELLCQLVTT